jgi:FMN phosphatase YigB (HAD superfamily)
VRAKRTVHDCDRVGRERSCPGSASSTTSPGRSPQRRRRAEDLADAVLNTSRIGYPKPDPRVYVNAAELVSAPVHQCLFLDDTAANLAAAQDIWMAAINYRQLSDLRDELAT